MQTSDIEKELFRLATQLRTTRIQIVFLALKDSKTKHPMVAELETRLVKEFRKQLKNTDLIDMYLDEIECYLIMKPEHHQFVQNFNRKL